MITIVILIIIIISIILYSHREYFVSHQREHIIKRIYDAYIKARDKERTQNSIIPEQHWSLNKIQTKNLDKIFPKKQAFLKIQKPYDGIIGGRGLSASDGRELSASSGMGLSESGGMGLSASGGNALRPEFKTKFELEVARARHDIIQYEIPPYDIEIITKTKEEDILKSGLIITDQSVLFTKQDIEININNWINKATSAEKNYKVTPLPKIIGGQLKFDNVLATFDTDLTISKLNKLFNKLISKIEVIEGDLIFINNKNVLDFSGFDKLKQIQGNLIITGNFVLNNICNLNLHYTKIEGTIEIHGNNNLKIIPRNIFANNTNNIYKIIDDDVPHYITKTDPYFCGTYEKKLLNFPLSDSGKEFIEDNWKIFMEKYEFGTYINGPLKIIDSEITNNNYKDRDFFELDYKKDNDGCPIRGLNKLLQSVKVINGNVLLKNCPKLTNLSAFKNISIVGDITIENCNGIYDICGLKKTLGQDVQDVIEGREQTFTYNIDRDKFNLTDSAPSCTSTESYDTIKRTIRNFGNGWNVIGNYRTKLAEINGVDIDDIPECSIIKYIRLGDFEKGTQFEFIGGETRTLKITRTDNKIEILNFTEILNKYSFIPSEDAFKGNITITDEWTDNDVNTFVQLLGGIKHMNGFIKIKDFSITGGDTKRFNVFYGLKTIVSPQSFSISMENITDVHTIEFKNLSTVNKSIELDNKGSLKDSGETDALDFSALETIAEGHFSITNLQQNDADRIKFKLNLLSTPIIIRGFKANIDIPKAQTIQLNDGDYIIPNVEDINISLGGVIELSLDLDGGTDLGGILTLQSGCEATLGNIQSVNEITIDTPQPNNTIVFKALNAHIATLNCSNPNMTFKSNVGLFGTIKNDITLEPIVGTSNITLEPIVGTSNSIKLTGVITKHIILKNYSTIKNPDRHNFITIDDGGTLEADNNLTTITGNIVVNNGSLKCNSLTTINGEFEGGISEGTSLVSDIDIDLPKLTTCGAITFTNTTITNLNLEKLENFNFPTSSIGANSPLTFTNCRLKVINLDVFVGCIVIDGTFIYNDTDFDASVARFDLSGLDNDTITTDQDVDIATINCPVFNDVSARICGNGISTQQLLCQNLNNKQEYSCQYADYTENVLSYISYNSSTCTAQGTYVNDKPTCLDDPEPDTCPILFTIDVTPPTNIHIRPVIDYFPTDAPKITSFPITITNNINNNDIFSSAKIVVTIGAETTILDIINAITVYTPEIVLSEYNNNINTANTVTTQEDTFEFELKLYNNPYPSLSSPTIITKTYKLNPPILNDQIFRFEWESTTSSTLTITDPPTNNVLRIRVSCVGSDVTILSLSENTITLGDPTLTYNGTKIYDNTEVTLTGQFQGSSTITLNVGTLLQQTLILDAPVPTTTVAATTTTAAATTTTAAATTTTAAATTTTASATTTLPPTTTTASATTTPAPTTTTAATASELFYGGPLPTTTSSLIKYAAIF